MVKWLKWIKWTTKKNGRHRDTVKKARLEGKEYLSMQRRCTCVAPNLSSEKFCNVCQTVEPKAMVNVTCKCKCGDRMSLQHRGMIFDDFYNKGSRDQQNDFLCFHIEVTTVGRVVSVNSKRPRNCTYVYKLPSENPEGEKLIKVCKNFFMGTLAVGPKRLRVVNRGRGFVGTFDAPDSRGAAAVTKIKELSVSLRAPARNFIRSLPVQRPHYSRTQGCRDGYLDMDTGSFSDVYRAFRDSQRAAGAVRIAGRSTFFDIFNREFNIGFARPIKDKCVPCLSFKNTSNQDEKSILFDEHHLHITRAQAAYKSKSTDKNLAIISEGKLKVFTIDMQSVLYTPFSKKDATLFYTRKFAFYNFTSYDLANGDVFCFLWSEVDAKRGAVEVGSCIYRLLTTLPEGCREVVLYSDTCAGQNRNRLTMSLGLYMVKEFGLESITQKYMETGHSEMEVDSAHSAIENFRKDKKYTLATSGSLSCVMPGKIEKALK